MSESRTCYQLTSALKLKDLIYRPYTLVTCIIPIKCIGSNARAPLSTVFVNFLLFQMIINGVNSLTCMTCIMDEDETTELHKFRISARHTSSTCIMEPIKCESDQDTCVKIVMHMGSGKFWIGSGCDYRKNFRHNGCKTEPVYTRSIHGGQIYERRMPQRTCVCSLNLCNTSVRPDISIVLAILLFLINHTATL